MYLHIYLVVSYRSLLFLATSFVMYIQAKSTLQISTNYTKKLAKNEVKSIPYYFRFAIFEGSKPNAMAVFPLHLVDWHLLQFSVKVLHNQLLRWMPPNAMPFFDFCLPNPRVLFQSLFFKNT